MTEETTNRISLTITTSVVVGLLALAAYVFQEAVARTYGAHFGVHHVPGDPRQAVISVQGVAVVVAVTIGTVWLAVRVADVSIPAALVVTGIGGVAFGLMGSSLTEGLTVLAACVVVFAACVRVWRQAREEVTGIAATYPNGRIARVVTSFPRVRAALTPPPLVVWLAAALTVTWAAWLVGGWAGRVGAEARTVFDVTSRDATRATVIFTTRGDIVERVLDVTPGTDGTPRNVWLPGVTIRPMPDGGIRYKTVHLGRTEASEPSPP